MNCLTKYRRYAKHTLMVTDLQKRITLMTRAAPVLLQQLKVYHDRPQSFQVSAVFSFPVRGTKLATSCDPADNQKRRYNFQCRRVMPLSLLRQLLCARRIYVYEQLLFLQKDWIKHNNVIYFSHVV